MTPEQRELKPCPFCGDAESQLIEHVEGTIIHPAYFVKCDNCGAVGPTTDKGNHRELWSRRAQVEALTVPQWISVETALPPIGQEVLVHVPGSDRRPVTALMRLIAWEGSPDFYWDNSYPGKGNMHIGTSITHWMSMPAAPAIPRYTGNDGEIKKDRKALSLFRHGHKEGIEQLSNRADHDDVLRAGNQQSIADGE